MIVDGGVIGKSNHPETRHFTIIVSSPPKLVPDLRLGLQIKWTQF